MRWSRKYATYSGWRECALVPYHPQCNGTIKRQHQTVIKMIGKLSQDVKANWPKHLPKLIQAYNGTRSAIMGYSPHYLMFRVSPPGSQLTSTSPWYEGDVLYMSTVLLWCSNSILSEALDEACRQTVLETHSKNIMIDVLVLWCWNQEMLFS